MSDQWQGRYDHLDSRIGNLEARFSGFEAKLDAVIQAVNRSQQPFPWIGLLAILVAILVPSIGGFWAITSSQISHASSAAAQNRTAVLALSQEVSDSHQVMEYWRGGVNSELKAMEMIQNRLYDHAVRHDERISALEAESSAARVSRKAIGDYVAEMHRDLNRESP